MKIHIECLLTFSTLFLITLPAVLADDTGEIVTATSAPIYKEEIKVLNLNKSGDKAAVEMWLVHKEGWKMELHVKNNGAEAISFNTNIADLSKSQFADFPMAGAFQLMSDKKEILKIEGESQDGWFYPVIGNSELLRSQMMFPNNDMEPCELPAGGEKVIKFDGQKAFRFTGPVKAESCRVGVAIKVGVNDVGVNFNFIMIASDWFRIPQAQ